MSHLILFSHDEIERILQLDKNSPVWVIRKAIAAVAICGDLRICEVRNITLRDVVSDEEGVWIGHRKQDGEERSNEFVLPFNRERPHLCYASCLINYVVEVRFTNPINCLD